MPRSLPAEEIREEYTEVAELAETTDKIEFIEASLGLDQQVYLNALG